MNTRNFDCFFSRGGAFLARGKKKIRLKLLPGAFLLVLVISLVATGLFYVIRDWEQQPASVETLAPIGGEELALKYPDKVRKPSVVRMMAAGDNLIHSSIYKQALARGNGVEYDFEYAYEQVRDVLALADFSVLNQETPIASSKEPDTYPSFNSPPSLGDLMVDLGFTVFNHANNHILDKGASGALETIAYWKAKPGITLTGAYSDEADRLEVKKNTVNDITFSHIGVTEYLNGLNVPADSPLRVVSLTDNKRSREEVEATVKEMIQAAKKESDVVCVSMHWQREDWTDVTEDQRAWVQKLVDWGTDVVIGTGPHVIQPMEFIQREDGSRALVIYSLGNFISAQSKATNMLGGIADVTFTKDFTTGKTEITSAGFIPTVTHYDGKYQNIRIIPFEDYPEDLANQHGVRNFQSKFNYQFAKNVYDTVIGPEFLEQYH